jgi:diaminopimelate decarboxylase
MESTLRIIRRCFGLSASELQIGGIPAAAITERHGTPLFVYDRASFDRQLDSLRAVLPAEFDVYYSVKANPNGAILRHFVSRGCGLEVASAGEFVQALAACCPPERIVFAGPAKTDDELELTLRHGIGEIHLESEHEARRIAQICKRLHIRGRVAVRVNPSSDAQGGAMRMGGKAAPFGVDEERLGSVVDYIVSEVCLDLCGIHMFAGTQILDHTVLAAQYRKGMEVARAVASRVGRPLHTVDLGGGLGIPYFEADRELDLSCLSVELTRIMTSLRQDGMFKGTRLLIEPGRFLVGEAGVYIVRIIDIKESRGKKFLIVDGGMNHHLAASGNLGQAIKRNYPIVLLRKLDCAAEETVDVVGPLCTPLDTLGRSLVLPKAEVGDLIGILQSGAYARAASPLGFLSHQSPAEVWVDQGQDFLIRTRGLAEDAMRDWVVPSCLDSDYHSVALPVTK